MWHCSCPLRKVRTLQTPRGGKNQTSVSKGKSSSPFALSDSVWSFQLAPCLRPSVPLHHLIIPKDLRAFRGSSVTWGRDRYPLSTSVSHLQLCGSQATEAGFGHLHLGCSPPSLAGMLPTPGFAPLRSPGFKWTGSFPYVRFSFFRPLRPVARSPPPSVFLCWRNPRSLCLNSGLSCFPWLDKE